MSELTGRTAQVPAYTGPLVAVGVDETVDHPEYDSVAPVNLTALRYGRWSEVSALANVVDDLVGLNPDARLEIARLLWTCLAVGAVEAAAASLGASVDIEAVGADGDSDGRRPHLHRGEDRAGGGRPARRTWPS